MRKRSIFKSIAIFAMALVMVVSAVAPVTPAYAEPDDNKIIINAPKGEPGENNRFVAYQIFAGVHDASGSQLNVTGWGSGVNSESLMTALKADTSTVPDVDGSTKFGEQFTKAYEKYQAEFDGQLTEPAFVAEWLAKVSEGKTGRADGMNLYADAFARIVAKCLKEDGKKESTKQENGNNVQWTIDVKDPGYYLVKDTYKGTDASVSSYILSVLGSETVNIKASVPTVDKELVDDHGNMSEGAVDRPFEAVTYTITGSVSKNIDEFSTYKYVFTDTLSKGLDLVKYDPATAGNGATATAIEAAADPGADVKDSAGIKLYLYNATTTMPRSFDVFKKYGKELTGDWTATYKTSGLDDGKKVLTVTINDLKALAGADLNANSHIVLVYAAMMNKDAVIGNAGNSNDVTLTYSNDPYAEGGPGTSTGFTPPDESKVYTVGFNVAKVDGSNGDAALEGAKFKLKRWKNGDTSLEGPAEWAIVETVADGGGVGVPKYVIKGWTDQEDGATAMATGTGGKLQIVGIRGFDVKHEADTDHVYKSNFALVETTIPEGYQKMEDMIFSVQITVDADGKLAHANINIHDSNKNRQDVVLTGLTDNKLVNDVDNATLLVRNYKEPLLPLTGGIGRLAVLAASGAVVAVGAVVLFLALRKKKEEPETK